MPKQTEMLVNYSIGFKANIGNYESASVQISESERWNVEDLKEEDVQPFVDQRLAGLKTRLDARIESEWENYHEGRK